MNEDLFRNNLFKKNFGESIFNRDFQETRVHIYWQNGDLSISTQSDEIAWYDPIGDHLGHYDIDGFSPYHDISQGDFSKFWVSDVVS